MTKASLRGCRARSIPYGLYLALTVSSAAIAAWGQAASAQQGTTQLDTITVQGGREPTPQPATPAPAAAETPAVDSDAASAEEAWRTTGNPAPNQVIGNLPPAYPGGQVAVGARIGFLGDRSILDTPFSVTAYTDEQKTNQQARTIGDLLDNNPSFFRSTPRFTGNQIFTSRGFAVFSSDLGFNGLYGLTDAFYIGGLDGIERVEVLRGASGLANGIPPFQAVTGTINLVPKRAPDVDITRFTTRYMSDSTIGGHWDVSRRAGLNNEWGIRANVSHDQGDGPMEFGGSNNSNATVGLDYRGGRFRFDADFGYEDTRLEAPQVQLRFLPGFEIPEAPVSDRNLNQRWGLEEFQHVFGAVRAEYDLKKNITVSAAYGRSFSDDSLRLTDPQLLNPAGDTLTSQNIYLNYYNGETFETALRAKFNTGSVSHTASAAITNLDYDTDANPVAGLGPAFASNIYDPVAVPKPDLPAPVLAPILGFNARGYSIADTLGFFNDRVLLTVGARLQQLKIENFDLLTGALTSSFDEEEVTPAYALVVKPLENVSIYASYIEGLQQGGIAPNTAANRGQALPPLVTEQTELGVKVDFGTLGANVALFDITQPSNILDPATNIYAANGLRRHRGIELEVYGELAPRLRVLGGAAFFDGELEKTAGGLFDGDVPAGLPDTRLTMGLEWDTPFMDGLTLRGHALYTSSMFVGSGNTQTIPDWVRFDVGARYAFEAHGTPMVLRADILNVTDENYWESGSSRFISLGAPRTYLLSAQFDF